ncbi:isochorismatase family protein (plasmid) [Paraburkholderia sp. PREW-6R]|uniref:isochorismatase family protein n=1 Tax=Paraburkholderia sp. PREW-6R TaxID=3141544 RepID=UPI0031F57FE7
MSASATAKSALIVIDIQESFRQTPVWSDANLPAFREAVLRLHHGARENGVPVVHVFHVGRAAPFTKESGFVTALDWLPQNADVVFEKHTHNAFSDTGLDLWLRRRGIDHLVISGIRTEQCCETTTRVGSDIGYAVDFVTEATLTFPMTHAGSGRTYSPEEIKMGCELVLAERFARIASVDQVLSSWQKKIRD